MTKPGGISEGIHILTTQDLEKIKHAEYRRGRDNAFKDMAEKHPNCRADRDGDCTWELCPQNRDGEPEKTGRHCPIDNPQFD